MAVDTYSSLLIYLMSIINTKPSVILLFTNKEGAPQGDLLGRINLLSNNSCSWIFNSFSYVEAILYGGFAIDDTFGKVLMEISISRSGGSSVVLPGIHLEIPLQPQYQLTLFHVCRNSTYKHQCDPSNTKRSIGGSNWSIKA
jgi:hypothetical protein